MTAPSCVVRIDTVFPGKRRGLGTGIVVQPNGAVLTCEHVVAGALMSQVTFADRSQPVPFAPPVLLGNDLALIKPLVPLQRAERPVVPDFDSAISPGDDVDVWAFSTGASYEVAQHIPASIRGLAVSAGRIGLSAAINFGDSGGAVLKNDRLIGVVQSRDPVATGHAFAVPIGAARHVFEVAELALPAVTDAFTGRKPDIAKILDALRTKRLVTLTGLGGIGKTECARAVAQEASRCDWLPDGVFYVDLQSALSEAEVLTLLRDKLNILGSIDRNTIAPALRKDALYILDDLYQASIGDRRNIRRLIRTLWTESKPARYLVTSREPAGSPDYEHVIQLGRLEPPADKELFLLLRGLQQPEEKRRPDDDARIDALLEELEGYPLALVIAANLLAEATVEEVQKRWRNKRTAALQLPGYDEKDLDRLTGVEFSLAITYNDLKHAGARMLLGAMSFLPAGGTPPLFDACIGEDSGESRQILQRLGFLRSAGDRYVAYVPVREFAGRMLERETADLLRSRMDAWLLELATRDARPPINWRTRSREVVATIAAELSNLHAALDRADARRDDAYIAKLTTAFASYYPFAMAGHKAIARLTRALTAAVAVGDRASEAHLAYSLADVEYTLGSSDERSYRRALLIHQAEPRNRIAEATCLWSLSFIAMREHNHEKMIATCMEALAIFEEEKDDYGRARCIKTIGDAERLLKRPDDAERHYRQALELFCKQGDAAAEAETLRQLGELALARARKNEAGKVDEALSFFQKALSAFERAAHIQGIAYTKHELAEVEVLRGNADEALGLLVFVIAEFSRFGDLLTVANALVTRARALRIQGEEAEALETAKEAAKIATAIGGADAAETLEELRSEFGRSAGVPAG